MVLNPAKFLLKQGKTALLVCDIQSRFSKCTLGFDELVANTSRLIKACKLLDVPIIVTEQNPQILGSTVPEFDISGAKGPFPKTQFSMLTPEVNEALCTICSGSPPETVLLSGLEAHLCIETTAVHLTRNGYHVHAASDCISSHTLEDKLLALERMKQFGCVITTSESIILKLCSDSSHPEFKTILQLVRAPMACTESSSRSKL